MTKIISRLLTTVLAAVLISSCSSNPPEETKPESPPAVPKSEPVVITPPVKVPAKTLPRRPSGAAAKIPSAPAASGPSFIGNPRLTRFINNMVTRHGFDRASLNRLFAQVHHDKWISAYMNRQKKPKRKTNPNGNAWTNYRAKFVKASKINNGVKFWNENRATLQRASQRYGVPAEYIVSIIGVETNYGSNFGKFRVIDALTTIAVTNKRRGDKFFTYLKDFLVMTRQEGMNPLRPVGSHAGAMGYGQFMPGSFLNYAVDFDGNGIRNLWHPTDAIGSVANYFKKHGWRTGEAVTVRAKTSGNGYHSLDSGFKTNYSTGTLAKRGVTAARNVRHTGRTSLLVLPTRSGGEVWLGYNNFYVISRYNHSTYYSMAVHQLAQEIRRKMGR